MRTRISGGVLLIAALAITGSLLLLPGCSEKQSGDRVLDLPPDTFISFGPKEATLTYFKVQAYWYGADTDGGVEFFQVATVRDVAGIDLDTLDLPLCDPPDGGDCPWGGPDRHYSTWHNTYEREGTFVLPADSCCLDSIDNPAQDPQYALAPWGILVRAVDNEGQYDRTPASLFFTATNVIPKVEIVIPDEPVWGYRAVPPHPYVEWEGNDPDGDAAALEYKFIIIPEDSLNPTYPRYPPLDYVDNDVVGHASPEIGKWSNWVPADCTFVKDLELSSWIGAGLDHPLNVIVTVRDEGGAFLPENLYGNRYNNGKNSIKLVIIATGDGVKIKISAGALGLRQSGQEAQYENNVAGLFQGTEISFRFWGIEDRSRGEIAEAYRYYYDNPDDPTSAWNYWTSTEPIRERGFSPEWLVRYPLDGGRFAPSLGRHVFVVEVEDVNKVQTHCEFNIEVLEGPRRLPEKKILLVDDDHAKYLEPAWAPFDQTQTDLWEGILDGYNWERFYTGKGGGSGYGEEVPIRFIGDATTVIWVADDETVENPVSQLLKVCTELGNYLHSYVKVGGNLIIIGRDPIRATAYWSDWVENHPGQPHPDRRQNFTLLNFNPRYEQAEDDTLYNFMWEVFGVKQMRVPTPEIPFNMIWPCQICGSDWEGPIAAVPDVGPWKGQFGSAFYITEIRSADDDRWPLDVEAMYSTAYVDTSGVITPTEDNLIAVYAPGDERRGHAAYIGFPAEWFDHDEMKTMIRKLLTKFGEAP